MANKSILNNKNNQNFQKENSIKILLPQIIAVASLSVIQIVVGIATVYPAVLIPQLNEAKNSTNQDTIVLTDTENIWLLSCVGLVMPLGNLVNSLAIDKIGRLNLIKLSVPLFVLAWGMTAMAEHFWMLILARVIIGFAATLSINPFYVYVTEISSVKVRGAFLSCISPSQALGVLVGYLKGRYVNWRIIAWLSLGYSIVAFIFISFLPESPSWLASKKKLDKAKKSVNWFYRYQPESLSLKYAELEFLSSKEVEDQRFIQICSAKLKEFLQPSGYKPFLLLVILLSFQQFSGVHVVIMNAVIFFHDMGTEFDPYLASTYIAAMRLLTAILAIWFMRRFNRRTLLMTSCGGISLCMLIIGLFTKWIQDGSTTITWPPLAALMAYVFFAQGLMSIPFAITPELFNISLRGCASNFVMGTASMLLFTALYSYNMLCDKLGGVYNLQFFYATVSAIGVVFVMIFIPETHKKNLTEIPKYFERKTMYLTFDCKGQNCATSQ